MVSNYDFSYIDWHLEMIYPNSMRLAAMARAVNSSP